MQDTFAKLEEASDGRGERDTISIAFVREALVVPRQRGIDVARVLQRSSISPDLLHSAQARVPVAQYALLWQHLTRELKDEFFGMDIRAMKPGSFAMLCLAVLGTRTLGEALQRALRYLRLSLDGIEGRLAREDRYCHITLGDAACGLPRGVRPPPARAFAYGTYLLVVHGLACWLVGRRIPLVSVQFRCGEPDFSPEWRIMFSPRLEFSARETRAFFKSFYLDLPVIRDEADLKPFLRQAPANLLVKYRGWQTWSALIRRRLRTLDPASWPTFDEIAAEFHLSSSTLRRRLDDEGLSYRVILDDLRRDLAISLLSRTDATIQSIAFDLGFTESSAFHRAFKKWTGVSPGNYRVG
ncbi:transcriptional regulator, AraC family [Rhodomicrobium vannielii ATCC 17100]|uniref:Transcriptional regulator, AraC family n=1 Tax=Rhodomicrobium vannielii (strain ATCC 17100 / DSM 162 / LMG 4299 / NCIMB 10020 / ATH 3.1.1) TaxID=648757 RepID=E3I3E0_RHOVT|nr:AraC family transcriptional regulator [Rhodomicrobium vannielii]ADP72588.1 transcriptional regulator, AraC family [Rhodomicrobium vannielii ATCC 17100]